jgi:hypothetical protein
VEFRTTSGELGRRAHAQTSEPSAMTQQTLARVWEREECGRLDTITSKFIFRKAPEVASMFVAALAGAAAAPPVAQEY